MSRKPEDILGWVLVAMLICFVAGATAGVVQLWRIVLT